MRLADDMGAPVDAEGMTREQAPSPAVAYPGLLRPSPRRNKELTGQGATISASLQARPSRPHPAGPRLAPMLIGCCALGYGSSRPRPGRTQFNVYLPRDELIRRTKHRASTRTLLRLVGIAPDGLPATSPRRAWRHRHPPVRFLDHIEGVQVPAAGDLRPGSRLGRRRSNMVAGGMVALRCRDVRVERWQPDLHQLVEATSMPWPPRALQAGVPVTVAQQTWPDSSLPRRC